MGAQGTATVNFGAYPGTSQASVAVTGQAAILTVHEELEPPPPPKKRRAYKRRRR